MRKTYCDVSVTMEAIVYAEEAVNDDLLHDMNDELTFHIFVEWITTSLPTLLCTMQFLGSLVHSMHLINKNISICIQRGETNSI